MRYNGARYGPGLFQGKVSHAPLPEIPSLPVSPVPLHTYPPFPPPQLCHILSSSPDVKRYLFFKNPAVFRRNTVIFPEKWAIRGRTEILWEVLQRGVPLYGCMFSDRENARTDENPISKTALLSGPASASPFGKVSPAPSSPNEYGN